MYRNFLCSFLNVQQIMRNLVRRYVTVEQRKAESQGVTEDDVNEIKQDISAFRCEIVEILKGSGMNTSNVSGQGTGKYLANIFCLFESKNINCVRAQSVRMCLYMQTMARFNA